MAPGGSKYFVGMPTPAAAGVIAALVHGFHRFGPVQDWRWSVAWFLLAAGLGALMGSTIRYYRFKNISWTRKQPAFLIVILILLAGVMWGCFADRVGMGAGGGAALCGTLRPA